MTIFGFAQRAVQFADTPLLFLDTVAQGEVAGRYCATRREWLDAQLSVQERPALIFMHHNPIPTHLPAFDAMGFLDMHAFEALMARRKADVQHVFFGHTHLDLVGGAHGVPMSGLQSVSHQALPDFSTGRLRKDPSAPPVFAITQVAGASVVRHVLPVRDGAAEAVVS